MPNLSEKKPLIKRLEAGSYECEYNGVKFRVYHIQSHEYKTTALKHQNGFGAWSRVDRVQCNHWGFNAGTGAFGGYGSKKQAVNAAIGHIDQRY